MLLDYSITSPWTTLKFFLFPSSINLINTSMRDSLAALAAGAINTKMERKNSPKK
jgi:hypothetical protein